MLHTLNPEQSGPRFYLPTPFKSLQPIVQLATFGISLPPLHPHHTPTKSSHGQWRTFDFILKNMVTLP